MNKKDFRKHALNLRKQQGINYIKLNSKIITDKILDMPEIKNAHNIMLYLDFNNEVMTDNLINQLIKLNKHVFSPVTIKDERLLIPTQIKSMETDLKIGEYGIREPNSTTCNTIDPEYLDLVIVPAVAYDENCFRLGYGGGYYDRFLEKLNSNATTIGIAFECQIFKNVPKEDHDAKLNYIITEKRTLE